MQTEFPRQVNPAGQSSGDAARSAGQSAFDPATPMLTEEELELIELRYDQFIALATLDHLMEEL